MKSENSKVDKWIPICVVLILSMVCAVAMGFAFAADTPNDSSVDLGDSNTVLSTSTQISDVGNTSSTVNDNLSDNSNSQNENNQAIDNTNNAYSNQVLSSISEDQSNNIYVDGSNTNNGNGTSDNPYNNIKDAINAAEDGSTIIIANGTYIIPKIIIDKDITITGADDATVTLTAKDSNNGNFKVVDGGILTLNNLIFTGFNYKPDDGVFVNEGLLNIINCTFIDNKPFYTYLINNKKSLSIINSTFINNKASSNVILNNKGADLTISGSKFTNSYGNYGGLISSYSIVNIDSSYFENNSASNLGLFIIGEMVNLL